MAKGPRPWIVTPHDPIEKLDENLWAISSLVPGAPFPRRMPIVKLSDGRLVFIDAVPMDDAAMAEIKAWGTPAILWITNGYHRIDVHAFQAKFGLKVLAPEGSSKRIGERVKVDGHLQDLPADKALRAEVLAGSKAGEVVFITTAPSGKASVLFSDGIMNIQKPLPFVPRMMGFQGGPKVPPLAKLLFFKDKPGMRAQYERLAALPELGRIVMCHGDTISDDAPGAMRTTIASI